MKKTAIFICLMAIGSFVANAQDETNSPGTSKTQNKTESSDPENSSTSKSTDVNNSGVTSTSEGTLSNSGTSSMYNGTRLQISDLPKAVSQSIATQHKGWAPQEVYKIDEKGATAYEVVVKKNDDEMNLVYDANGNLLKTEQRSKLETK